MSRDMAPAAARPAEAAPVRPVPFAARLIRCLVGLFVCGAGVAAVIAADIGLGPWDVLHQGVSNRTGLEIGTVMILAGLTVMLAWIPLRVRPGLGTVLNALEIGLVVDLLLPHLPEPDAVIPQLALMVLGVAGFGVGSGLYIGAGLGPGPRDGLMTGISKRSGVSIRAARTGLEIAVFLIGWALGGTPGIGTAVFALAIGPVTQFCLERFGTWTTSRNDVPIPVAG